MAAPLSSSLASISRVHHSLGTLTIQGSCWGDIKSQLQTGGNSRKGRKAGRGPS